MCVQSWKKRTEKKKENKRKENVVEGGDRYPSTGKLCFNSEYQCSF